ncbi:MAG: hypothetical protein QOJ85_3968 [Solirubrobacteraceae bacterium]|jgi:hypothetical protein|nr:hypothetical protein [Solirubrobacteraceae bacterium]MEA2240827.1 hypothetical protein [Solirubrobacteraceae bacterium]
MGLISQAAAILDAGRLDTAALPGPGRDPQPVAYDRRGAEGAVMFLAVSRAGEWMCLLVLLERDNDAWEELSIVHKPWWGPQEAFSQEDLILTGGHSRFSSDLCAEVVAIPGQAASETSVRPWDSAAPAEPLAQGPWRHFVYVGCLDEPGKPVTLVAERAGAQETVVFEIPDAP